MKAEPTDLERSILHTLCWFAVQGYPVTAFELWKWLWFPVQSYTLADVRAALMGSVWLAARLEARGAFYTLRGENGAALVTQREERFVDATRKFGALRRATRYFCFLPSVLGVFAGNTLAWWYTRAESDIDVFVIARPGTVWLTRLLVVIPFMLLRRRPGATDRDPFCFSFFISADRLSLKKLQLFGGDPYLAYWTRSLVPVFDRGGIQDRFQNENAWCEEMLPHALPRLAHHTLARRVTLGFSAPWLHRLEKAARRLQERRLPKLLRERANQDSCVVVAHDMLKFHENDRREAFRDRFQELVTAYG